MSYLLVLLIQVEIFFLVIGVMALCHPVYLFILGYKDERRQRKQKTLIGYENYGQKTRL